MIKAINFNQNQRRIALKNLLFFVGIFFLIFSLFNFNNGISELYFLEILVSVVSFIFLWKFDSITVTRNLEYFSLVLTLVMFGYLLYALFIVGLSKTTHLWILGIPIVSYTLNGLIRGLLLTSVFIIISFIILSITAYDNQTFNFENTTDFVFLLIGLWVLSHQYAKSNDVATKKLYKLAIEDSLTEMLNRYAFYEVFKDHADNTTSLLIIDLDYFKRINDTYGHDAGDYVLKEVAKIFQTNIPNSAEAFRLGGEEFAIILPNATLDEGLKVSQDLLDALRNSVMPYQDHLLSLTASIGLATPAKIKGYTCKDLMLLMRHADKCLYQAKENGRNRVEYSINGQ